MAIIVKIKDIDKTTYLKKNTLRIDKQLENQKTLNLTFNCQASDWIPDIGQDIKVYDGAALLFGGIISSINKLKIDPEKSSNAYLEVTISSNGYESICARRTINCYYENKNAGEIFENICNRVLNYETANENIVYTASATGNTFDIYSASCESVKTIFDDIAGQSGLQWYINDNKQAVLTDETSITTAEHTIDVTGTFTDYLILGESCDLANYCNKVFVKGASEGIYATVEDSDEILNRISAEGTDVSGVYGKVLEANNIWSITGLEVVGENELKKYGFSPSEFKIRSFTSTWTVGTKINVYLPEYGMTANTTYLIEDLSIWRYDTDILAYDMTLSKRKSTDFSTKKSEKGKEYFEKLIKSGGKEEGIYNGVTGMIKNLQATNTAQITISDS